MSTDSAASPALPPLCEHGEHSTDAGVVPAAQNWRTGIDHSLDDPYVVASQYGRGRVALLI